MRSALLVSIALALVPSLAPATDANLDPSFGTFGWTAIDDGPGFEQGQDVGIQASGRVVVAGATWIVGVTPSGTLDPTFGTGGLTSTPGAMNARALAIQPLDGAIVLAGDADVAVNDGKMAVSRVDANGAVDVTFGTGGITYVEVPGDELEGARSVALQADGRIVAAGFATTGGLVRNVLVARLLATGALDPSFGTGGIVEIALPRPSEAEDVTIQPDGRIVVGGYTYVPYASGTGSVQAFLLIRLDTNGALDPSFDGTGIVVNGPRPEGSAIGYEVVVQPDGKILLGGTAGSSPHVLRYSGDGSPDGAFGVVGVAKTQFGPYDYAPMFDLELRPDGTIVLVGAVQREGSSVYDTALVRFDADGALDTTFTPTGRARVTIGPRQSGALAAVQIFDGRIVTTGFQSDAAVLGPETDAAILLARFGGSCGNAFLDAGEQCDDGNTGGLDCCSAGCGYDPAGQLCAGDASACTWDTCDGAGACVVGGAWPASECLAVTQPLKSALAIKDHVDDNRDKIVFKWTKGPDLFQFGLPSISTDYSLCVFGGGTLASEHAIPAGTGWSLTPKGDGWKLKRSVLTHGIQAALLKTGIAGKSKITVKGKGALVGAPAIPLATPVTAQLVSPQGDCFGATYATPAANANGRFKGRGQ